MMLRSVRRSTHTDIHRAHVHLNQLGPKFAPPKTRWLEDIKNLAVIENDYTLIDSNGDWILRQATRRFYENHRDDYDFVSFFPQSGPDNGSYHLPVFNDIQGIGKAYKDHRREYGSAGRLQSVHLFLPLSKLPPSPTARILDNNDSTLSLIAQEFGHRWAAFVWFRDRQNGDLPSSDLLGRDQAHWSFFLNTNASSMEGNKWETVGGYYYSFDETDGYCELDQYLMGFRRPEEVGPLTLIESQESNWTSGSRPKPGVRISGRPKVITVQDIIDFEGERVPDVNHAPKSYRHAFVMLLTHEEELTPEALHKLDTIRTWWQAYFFTMTDGRGRVDTTL